MKQTLISLIQQILQEIGIDDVKPVVEIPADLTHGDYTTNVAMVLAKLLKRNPIDIAKEIVRNAKCQMPNAKYKIHDQFTKQKDQKVSEIKQEYFVLQDIDKIEVIPPGFINFHISASKLSARISEVLEEKEGFGTVQSKDSNSPQPSLHKRGRIPPLIKRGLGGVAKKKIMVEFAHPNTHKAFHIGHLRNITTGESIVRLLEFQGFNVVRANYQGDVGMHIAKCLYGILQDQKSKIKDQKLNFENLKTIHQKVEYLGKMYALGSKAFEESETARKEIGEINKKIYEKDPEIWDLYQTTRQWSLDYFEAIYKRMGSHYDRYYFESEVYESGKANTLKGLEKGIFVNSDGAVIFPGEKFGLHNRVFITSEGNPTYEGKDMGLGPLQFKEYDPDLIIHVVGPEQAGYFQVVFEALAQLFPQTKGREYHLIYGWVKLKQGKMSSRTGNVVLGEWLIDEAKKEIYNILERSKSKDSNSPQPSLQKGGTILPLRKRELEGVAEKNVDDIAEKAAIAAVKYSFLKVSTRQEIAFDIKESVSFEGDSGPYLQYTYARARSVLRKAVGNNVILEGAQNISATDRIPSETPQTLRDSIALPIKSGSLQNDKVYNNEELSVMRMIYKFPEVVAAAAKNYAPNILCKYLYDLASSYNTFYNKHQILDQRSKIKDQKQDQISNFESQDNIYNLQPTTYNFRLLLTAATAQVIKNGLYLLGIEVLERM